MAANKKTRQAVATGRRRRGGQMREDVREFIRRLESALVAGRRAGWTWLRTGVFAAGQGTLGIVLLLLERVAH
jgi:hypothetical protein